MIIGITGTNGAGKGTVVDFGNCSADGDVGQLALQRADFDCVWGGNVVCWIQEVSRLGDHFAKGWYGDFDGPFRDLGSIYGP